jgi:CHAD domain-containing protein
VEKAMFFTVDGHRVRRRVLYPQPARKAWATAGTQGQIMSNRISDLNEMTPVENAARRVLALRLESVRDRIADALSPGEERRQHVHALRVASRRAAAAVELFAAYLPKKVFKEVRFQLRLIRRAVGTARDWDVVLAHYSDGLKHAELVDQPAYDMLIGYALAHRVPAQLRLEQACPEYPFGFDRFMASTLAAIRSRESQQETFGGYARPLIAQMVGGFNTMCDRDDGDWVQLHQVRITGKRLRYSLELVRECFDESLDTTVAPALVSLQETLGVVNDNHNAAHLLREILGGLEHCHNATGGRYRAFVERQLQECEILMRNGREEFRRWLQQWRSPAIQQALQQNASVLRSDCNADESTAAVWLTPE